MDKSLNRLAREKFETAHAAACAAAAARGPALAEMSAVCGAPGDYPELLNGRIAAYADAARAAAEAGLAFDAVGSTPGVDPAAYFAGARALAAPDDRERLERAQRAFDAVC
jgi:hypothetical protein